MRVTGEIFMEHASKIQRGLPVLDRLIPHYLAFEKLPLKDSLTAFPFIFRGLDASLIEHLQGQWKGKKRAFDDFYLNLDHRCDRKLLEFWGETVEPDRRPDSDDFDAYKNYYLDMMNAADSFDVHPFETHLLFRWLRMAYNSGIKRTAAELGIASRFTQSKIKDYGCGTYWGRFWVFLTKQQDEPAKVRILEYALRGER